MKINILFLIPIIVLIQSCSLFSRGPDKKVIKQDIPMQARSSPEAQPKKRVMVLPFLDVSENRSQNVSETARKSLILSLASTNEYVLIHPGDLPKDPKNFLINGQYDLEALAKLAQPLGIVALLEGKVLEIKAKKLGDEVGLVRKTKAQIDANVNLRIYSVKTNKIIMDQAHQSSIESASTQVGTYQNPSTWLEEDQRLVRDVVSSAFRGAMGAIVKTVNKLSWEGRIALIQGNRIFLNAGRLSGLQVGDILKVSTQGEEIYDPESGDLIGIAPGRMKGTIELISYFGKDGAISVIHSGSGFKENDLVELY